MLKHCRTSPRTEFGYRKVGICFADIKELLVYHKKLKKNKIKYQLKPLERYIDSMALRKGRLFLQACKFIH